MITCYYNTVMKVIDASYDNMLPVFAITIQRTKTKEIQIENLHNKRLRN